MNSFWPNTKRLTRPKSNQAFFVNFLMRLSPIVCLHAALHVTVSFDIQTRVFSIIDILTLLPHNKELGDPLLPWEGHIQPESFDMIDRKCIDTTFSQVSLLPFSNNFAIFKSTCYPYFSPNHQPSRCYNPLLPIHR